MKEASQPKALFVPDLGKKHASLSHRKAHLVTAPPASLFPLFALPFFHIFDVWLTVSQLLAQRSGLPDLLIVVGLAILPATFCRDNHPRATTFPAHRLGHPDYILSTVPIMADYDPANQGGAWGEDEGYGNADGYHRSAHTQHSSLEEDEDQLSNDQVLHAPGDVPSDDGASDVADYDPETVTSIVAPTPHIAEPAAAPRPSPKPTAKKPKTAGGFIVDSDSEDDDTSTPGSSGLAPPASSNQTHPRTASPLQNMTTLRDVQATPTADQESEHRTSSAAPNNGNDKTLAASLPAANTQQVVPQDKVVVLEDRVREDPRGAMDAWLALLREYRDRNNINDARKTYDRFLAVFPQAVSTRHLCYLRLRGHPNADFNIG